MEALKYPTPNATFSTINDTHHTALRNLAELFKVIPKLAQPQSTNRHNGRQCEVEKEPGQARAQVRHKNPTMQQKNQVPTPRVN